MLSAALKLAATGMAVFPCRVRDKRPATANGFKDASRDHEQIRAWWQSEPNFNIGIATGTMSSIFVVDVDDDGGEHELCKLGVLPDTVEAITARGRHIYFRMPRIQIGNSAGKVAPHVDVRGDGGYVLAPPSIHPSGRRYCWSVDSSSAFADAPLWLLDKLTDQPCRRADPSELISDAAEGQRNDRVARLAGHLLRHRVHIQMTANLLLAWNAQHCIPPLGDDEVLRTIDSISKCESRRRGH
jgi:Bifunctional DNA primase/polymerase, N-terminal/Primase C terminal 1 (PriCT-1)